MKITTFIISALCATGLYAQSSLDEYANEWKNGEYVEYTYSDGSFSKQSNKIRVEVIKNDVDDTRQVNLDLTEYKFYGNEDAPFVVSYDALTSSNRLYVTDKAIVKYTVTAVQPFKVELVGCIGKEVNSSITTEIESFLEENKNNFVHEDPKIAAGLIKSFSTVLVTKSKKIKTGSEIQSGTPFDIGCVINYTWGLPTKTENLGGTLESFKLRVSSLSLYDSKVEDYPFLMNCDNVQDGQLKIDVSANGLTKKYPAAFSASCP